MTTVELVPSKDTLGALTLMAKSAQASKFYDKLGGEQGILSIMLLARELDIPPMQALSGGIWNIQGKVEISARMMNMKIRQAGHKLEIKKMVADGCEITGTRKDTGETLTTSFLKEDADRAGVLQKDVWKKFPREMYFARALSLLARMLFPDVIGNCYVEGEISDAPIEAKPAKFEVVEMVSEPVQLEAHTEPAQDKITSDQLESIVAAIAGDGAIEAKIITFLNIEGLDSIPASQFARVMKSVEKAKKVKDGGIS